MKVLICTSTFKSITHGPSKFVSHIFKSPLFEENTDLRILTEDIDQEIPGKVYKYSRNYPKPFGAFWEYGDNYIFYKNLKRITKEFHPDVIVFINTTLAYLSVKKLSSKFKFVGFINDDEALLNGRQHTYLSKLWVHKKKARILEKRAAKLVSHVIANSSHISKLIQKEYKLSSDKVSILYKGIDLHFFAFIPRKKIEPNQRIEILFVKSDFERGGLFILYKALLAIKNYSFKLIVCGLIKSEDLEYLIESTAHIEIELLGTQSQSQIKQLMISSDILSVPALREGLGVVNIEGLAIGIPIVTSDAGGIPEVMNKEENGWVARANDEIYLSRQLLQCIENDQLREQKRQAGREWVENNFSHEKMIQDFYDLLKEICQRTVV